MIGGGWCQTKKLLWLPEPLLHIRPVEFALSEILIPLIQFPPPRGFLWRGFALPFVTIVCELPLPFFPWATMPGSAGQLFQMAW